MDITALLKCECGVVAKVFTNCGTSFAGHYCLKLKCWTIKSLPTIQEERDEKS